MNNNITAEVVMAIAEDGKNLGEMTLDEAMDLAAKAGLDVVEVACPPDRVRRFRCPPLRSPERPRPSPNPPIHAASSVPFPELFEARSAKSKGCEGTEAKAAHKHVNEGGSLSTHHRGERFQGQNGQS